jgi:hypothetical protein
MRISSNQLSIGPVLGLAAAGMLSLALFNGLIMLFSPSKWFDLPSYLAFRGTLRRDQYLRTKSGILQIRFLGFMFAAFVIWMIAGLFDFHFSAISWNPFG